MPQALRWVEPPPVRATDKPKVVYLPACISRVMGPAAGSDEPVSLFDKTCALLEKAGFEVIFPAGLDELCCGQPFASKGYLEQGERKREELLAALLAASEQGRYPIYCDTSPCTLRLVQGMPDARLNLYDPVRFIREHLLERLAFEPIDTPVAVHVTCSTQHLGEAEALLAVARRCSTQVVVPEGIHCCGFAGDKGFSLPALNDHALRSLKSAVQHCELGVSTSRTCEIGLSSHSGIDYRGLVYLVDRVTRPIA